MKHRTFRLIPTRDERSVRRFVCLAVLSWVVILLFSYKETAKERDPRPNLLLISLDTLRADRLGMYGYGRSTSPFLDELAGRGRLFRHAFVNTHGTPPSHATLMTSQYQQTHRVSYEMLAKEPDHFWPADLVLLPEVLRDAGYATIGVTAGGYMSESFGLNQGYDVFHGEPVNLRRGIRKLLREVKKKVGKGKPIFAFFHTYEIHSPYDPPDDFRHVFGKFDSDFEATNKNLNRFRRRADELKPVDIDHLNALYDAGIRYADEQMRAMFLELEQIGFFDHYVTVVTSDHGEEFGEHNGLLHPATLYEEVLRVPLIVEGTGVQPGVEDRLASTIDIAPTLYRRARVRPPRHIEGRDLLSTLPEGIEEAVFAQYGDMLYGIRTHRFKLVDNRRTKRSVLFDLVADPGEKVDVSGRHPERMAELKARLDAWIEEADLASVGKVGPTQEIDDEQRRQLEALGYL